MAGAVEFSAIMSPANKTMPVFFINVCCLSVDGTKQIDEEDCRSRFF